MFRRVVLLLGFLAFSAAQSLAQSPGSPIVIDEDLRIFATVAALNVSGFDVELGPQYHPARAELRKVAETLDPDLLNRLRRFYTTHKNGRPDEEQLAKYISLAVFLTDPPALKPIAREESLPGDARTVLGFVPLLQEFVQNVGIGRLWARVSPAYEAEMDRIGPSVRDAITLTDSYLRVALGGLSTQTMRISVELGAPQNSVNVRSNQDIYSVVLGYTNTPKVEEIRHAYLHVRLNNYVTAAMLKVKDRDALLALLQGQDGIQREYVSSFDSMMAESLIRAAELRMDRTPPNEAAAAISGYYRTGLLLAPYFYSSLIAYENDDGSLRDAIPTMAESIDVGKEQKRFAETFHSIPVPERPVVRGEVPVEPATDPVMELLRTAQAVFENDKAQAEQVFEKVLKDYDPENGRALYGLGLIEMERRNLDEALGYFKRTMTSDSADPSMRTWSYIYAGHILDFKCEREAAVEYYRKAVETGDNTRDAQRVVSRDLAQPFGGECPQ